MTYNEVIDAVKAERKFSLRARAGDMQIPRNYVWFMATDISQLITGVENMDWRGHVHRLNYLFIIGLKLFLIEIKMIL